MSAYRLIGAFLYISNIRILFLILSRAIQDLYHNEKPIPVCLKAIEQAILPYAG
jgi:hypothetical protein